jgi:hypothetical protein
VSAGLVDSHDMVVIAANLQKLIDTTATMGKNVTFPLVSYQMAAAVRTTFYTDLACSINQIYLQFSVFSY